MTSEASRAGVAAIFERFAATGVAPGVAYGVVVGGELVLTGGHGRLRIDDGVRPDADGVFRIASMTKSFTAAAVLLLRDDGRLRLDDAVADWVPELADLAGPTTDSPRLTIEHLLTMSAGFPTDDPWGDRQQGLPLAAFADLLRAGVGFAWPPGTRFSYSNLGYGILGRVVTAVAGEEYRDVVRRRLLEPLGMSATAFDPADVPADRLAGGSVRRDDAWLPDPIDPYGALASMGGVFTSVRDLARWVAGFTDAFPPRDGPEAGHPLSRATRREMQQVHRSIDPEETWASVDGQPALLASGYGYGLFVFDDLRLGRLVGHGGGYPGFGSHMRWHPASGIGVIGFGNARYAPMMRPVRDALAVLLAGEPARIRRVQPSSQTAAAQDAVEALLDRWDDGQAAALFSMNVELDEPLSRRRAAFDRVRAIHGRLVADPTAPAESSTPAHLTWWLRGDRGRVRVEMLLDPLSQTRVQALTVTSVPEPPSALTTVAQRVVALLGTPGPAWPTDLAVAETVDRVLLGRSVRAAEALVGPVTLGAVIAGDGERAATWRLDGDRGQLDLRLELDPDTGALTVVGLVPPKRAVPTEAV